MLVLAVFSNKSHRKENYVTITVPPSNEPQEIRVYNTGDNKNSKEQIRIGFEASRQIMINRSDCKNIPPEHDPNNIGIRR